MDRRDRWLRMVGVALLLVCLMATGYVDLPR